MSGCATRRDTGCDARGSFLKSTSLTWAPPMYCEAVLESKSSFLVGGPPTRVAVRTALALLAVLLVAGCGSEQQDTSANAPAGFEEVSPPAPEPMGETGEASVVITESWCRQDPVVGDVDVVVTLDNGGLAVADDLELSAKLVDSTGDEDFNPFKDIYSDVPDVPAGATDVEARASSDFAPSKVLDHCLVELSGEDASLQGEVRIEARDPDDLTVP